MLSSKSDESHIRLYFSRIILAVVMLFSIYTFFEKEPIAAKLLSFGGFILLLILLIMSFKSPSK